MRSYFVGLSHAWVGVVAVLLMAGAARGAVEASDENLLVNGDFEAGLAQWAVSDAYESATVDVVKGGAPEVVHSGAKALRIRNEGGWSNIYHAARHPLEGKQVYELSFWARAGNAVTDADGKVVEPGVYVNEYEYGNYEAPGPTIFLDEKRRLRPRPVGSEWRQYVVGFLMPGGGRYREFCIALGTRGDVILDDVQLRLKQTKLKPVTDREQQGLYNSERFDASHVTDIELRLATPHLPFARPLAGERVKALFFAPLQHSGATRDVAELSQRFDMDFSAVTMYYPWTFSNNAAHFRAFGDVSLAEKTDEAMARLGEGPEVTVLGTVVYACLPAAVQNQIMSRVRNGMGLVVSWPRKLPAEYEPDEIAAARDEILTGVSLAGLPEFFWDEGLSPVDRRSNAVRAYEVGKGRVVVIRWTQAEPADGEGLGGLVPGAAGGRWSRQYEHRYNYHLALVSKAIQWAARQEPRAQWSRLPADGQSIRRADLPARDVGVEVTWNGPAKQAATLTATVRDPLGNVESTVEQACTLAPGVNALPVPLPRLKCGLHYLELSLSTTDGVENWATVSLQIEGPENIAELTTEEEYYERGETVRGVVKFTGALPEAAKLTVCVRDTNDRVYNRAAIDVPAGATEMPFQIAVDRPTTLATYVEAELVRDKEVLSYADAVVFVPKRDFKDFLSVAWCTVWNEGIGQVALRQLRRAGFNTVYHWGGQCGDFENDAMADMMPAQYCCRLTLRPDDRGWATGAVGHGRLDPEYQAWVKRLKKSVQASMRLGPPYYSLGDEDHFQFGFGYSPYELQAYKQYLTKRYGTIERLNEEYGAQYKTFEEVPRYKEPEAVGEGLIPALIDHRLGTDDEWANYFHDLAREIRSLDPNARVGAEGSECGNMEKMLEGVQLWAPYGGQEVLQRSLASPDHMTSHWWGGPVNGEQGPGDCTILWREMIRGFANFNQWFCTQHIDGAMLNSDYSYRPYFEALLPELAEIYAGPALLLRDAQVVSDREIAVHFSRESEHASVALTALGTTQKSTKGIVQVLNLLRRDYRYISSNQIVAGRLGTPRAKILFLPSTHTMSEAAADGIRQFVHEGGTVVADFLPALNEYGRRLGQGRLDALFGATRAGEISPAAVHDVNIDADVNGQALKLTCPTMVVDGALEATDAQALVHTEQIPLLLVNKHGRGTTILLNFDLSRCPGTEQVAFISALLEAAKAHPEYKLVGPPSTQVSVLRRGGLTLVGVILPRLDPQNPRQDATVTWAEPKHVYDVRAGQYLGRSNQIDIAVSNKEQRVHLFAVQSQQLTGLDLEAPLEIDRGQTLSLKAKVNFAGGDPAQVNRVVRIDVADPSGEPIMHYRDFLTLTGASGQSQIPFAFNDPPGQWTITATDVATGASASTAVTLTP